MGREQLLSNFSDITNQSADFHFYTVITHKITHIKSHTQNHYELELHKKKKFNSEPGSGFFS